MSDVNPEQPLINREEMEELRNGEIERVEDEGPNTPADLARFLEEQKGEAKDILKAKAKALFSVENSPFPEDEKKEILETSEALADRAVEEAMGELTIATVRVACSKLSDIVGVQLEVDEDGIDQFGLTKRYAGQETKHGVGFIGYKEEEILPRRGEPLGHETYPVPGRLNVQERRIAMHQFDAQTRDIDAVMAGLQKYGTAEYKEFGGTGPVLVILPEMHYDSGILSDNFNAVLELIPHISVLGTEGMQGILTENMIGVKSTESAEAYREKIRNNEVAISTEAVEDVLGDRVYTVGLEYSPTLLYVGNEIQKRMANVDSAKTEAVMEIAPETLGDSISTKEDLMRFQDASAELFGEDFVKDTMIAYRNQIWLLTLQQLLLYVRSQHSSKSNIAFLVCGRAHAADLEAQAHHFGFKGIVQFRAHSWDEKVDLNALKVYAKQQLGMSGDQPTFSTEQAPGHSIDFGDLETTLLEEYGKSKQPPKISKAMLGSKIPERSTGEDN